MVQIAKTHKSKKCLLCGKKFIKNYHVSSKTWDLAKFCSRKCASIKRKGIPSWNIGKHHSENTIRKLSESHKGQKAWNKGIPSPRGELSPNWKGGWRNNPTYMKDWFRKKKEKIAGREMPESCEICSIQGKIVFDHDHVTGKFRGWICERCNFSLGHAKDNPETLEKMAKYLRESKRNADTSY